MKTYFAMMALLAILSSPAALAEETESDAERSKNRFETDILVETFGFSDADSDIPLDDLHQGCPARDCIVSIDAPEFVSASEVGFLVDDDLVLAIEIDGVARAYPARFLDHHEIVNDTVSDTPVAVTWCPLCGSGVAFLRTTRAGVTEFGVSGVLHNSDLVMYDRATESLWQQITGEAFAGASRGEQLTMVPMVMAEWAEWTQAHPDGEVMTMGEANIDYKGGAYAVYETSDDLAFPVSATDSRLHPKKVVYGVEIGDQSFAVEEDLIKLVNRFVLTGEGEALVFELTDDGGVSASKGDDPLVARRMFWFAWFTFHPNTVLISASQLGN